MAVQPPNQLGAWLVEGGAVVPLDDRLERTLCELVARARTAWPQLTVDERDFVHALATAVRDEPDPVTALGALAVEDLYLARACIGGAREALAAFAASCDGAIAGALRQMNLPADSVDEVVHDVRSKVLVAADGPPKIATYSGRARLASWLRTIATRMALDRIRDRKEAPTDDLDALERIPAASDSPELAHFRAMYSAEFKAAFEEALSTLDVRERNLLRHHFVDNLTLDEIGALYGVHKTTAFRWVEAARTALSKRTRTGFQKRVRLVTDELDSVLRLVQSQIDLSLSRVLA
ncbi:MAG TPA: sigma-70 family RNA polymerase sigma factor [Kofleriaceae bacterium]|nr:sigma-70 family RNA polymerase sigma factor [Kofleriaceae bacterium]